MSILQSKRHNRNLTAVQESNYMKLLRVVPFIHSAENSTKHSISHSSYSFELTILDVTPYTTIISVSTRHYYHHSWLPQLQMTVRCYHDARVAEVINFQHHTRFKAKYDYPNNKMYQKNEKQQINRFLGEWLNHCLRSKCVFKDRAEQVDA